MHTVRLIESVRAGEQILDCTCGKREFLQDGAEPVCGRCGAGAAVAGEEFPLQEGVAPVGELLPLPADEPVICEVFEGAECEPMTAEQQAEWDAIAERNTAALEAMMDGALESPAEASDVAPVVAEFVEPVSVPEAVVEPVCVTKPAGPMKRIIPPLKDYDYGDEGLPVEDAPLEVNDPEDIRPPVKCSGANKSGKPCGAWALEGFDRCRMHPRAC